MKGFVHFVVPGKPRAWHRAASRGSRRYTSSAQLHLQNDIAWTARQAGARVTAQPVMAIIRGSFAPSSKLRKAQREALIGQSVVITPDADNGAKLILDALNGVAYRDDAQVSVLVVQKVYAWVAQTDVWLGPAAGALICDPEALGAALVSSAEA